MDPAPNESSASLANEQQKSANLGGDKKPELPVISEPKGTDQTDSAVARGDSEKKEKEAQEQDALLGFVQLLFLVAELSIGLYTILKEGTLFLVGEVILGVWLSVLFNVGFQCTTMKFIHIAFVLFDMQLRSILNLFLT